MILAHLGQSVETIASSPCGKTERECDEQNKCRGCIHVMRLYMHSFCARSGAAVSHNIKSVRISQRAHMRRKT